MIFGRLIGWYLFFAGFGALVEDVLSWASTARWQPLTVGELWYAISPPHLVLAPYLLQPYLSPVVWDAFTKLLSFWAFLVLLASGAVIIRLFRESDPDRFHRRAVHAARSA